MKNIIQTVNFHGQTLIAIPKDGQLYVGMKVICENIGIDWRSQRQRIMRNEVMKAGVVMITTPSKGGKQETLCLPLPMLNGWLFGIDVNRVKESATRDLLIQYQRECFGVLYDYWHKGEAKNLRLSDKNDRTPLKNAVNALVAKTSSLNYSEAYRMVWQRFGVEGVDELTVEQIPQAVAYVHELTLKAVQFGELLPREDKDAERAEYVRRQRVCAVSLMTTGYLRWREQEAALQRLQEDALDAMERLQSILARSNAILGSVGAVHDALYEAQSRLCFPRDVLDEGRALAEEHYKPRIVA